MPTPSPDDRRATLILLGITLVGGLLRFAWLGHPCLWGDEALVYWRTCGTYGQLLHPLHVDGFPPLHYELLWLIVRSLGRTPGPAAMRAVAATCGTLLVPAVYFMARQLVARRTALLAAAFTAGSGFALFYSRDAKMYGEAWLTMTVSVACLMWWLRTGGATPWLGWVAAGAAAGGFQTLTLVSVAGLSPLLLLTQRKAHWRQAVLCLAGIGLIVAGPVGYYARFNGWTENVDDQGWNASGLAWVQWYNVGRTGPDQARYLATTFLTGWEWPRLAQPASASGWPSPAVVDDRWVHWSQSFAGMPLRRAWGLTLMTMSVFAVLAAGALPWRTAGRFLAMAFPRRFSGGDPGPLGQSTDSPEPAWRATLWLSAWVALAIYGFHCRSVADFATPGDILGLKVHSNAWLAVGVISVFVLTTGLCFRVTRSTAVRWAQLAMVLVGIVAACQGLAMGMAAGARAASAAGHPWNSVWVPRYLGFVWPALAVMVGALLSRLPTRAGRAIGLTVVLAANLGMFAFRQFGPTEPPVDRMAADVWASQPAANGRPSNTLTWMNEADRARLQTGPGEGNLFSDPGRYYLQLLAGRPMSPDLFKQSLATFTVYRGDVAGVSRVVAPRVQRVIVWEQFPDPPEETGNPLPGWNRSDDQTFAVRDVWTGQDRAWYRRRAYDRPPSTQP